MTSPVLLSSYCTFCQQKHTYRAEEVDTLRPCERCGRKFQLRPYRSPLRFLAVPLGLLFCGGLYLGVTRLAERVELPEVGGLPAVGELPAVRDLMPGKKAAEAGPAKPGKVDRDVEQKKAAYHAAVAALYRSSEEADAEFNVNTDPATATPRDRRERDKVARPREEFQKGRWLKYAAAVEAEYDLTHAELQAVMDEGQAKRWPKPSRRRVVTKSEARDRKPAPVAKAPTPAAPEPARPESPPPPEPAADAPPARKTVGKELADEERAEKERRAAEAREREAADKLLLAKELLRSGKREAATARFQQIVEDYPGTKAAAQAADALQSSK